MPWKNQSGGGGPWGGGQGPWGGGGSGGGNKPPDFEDMLRRGQDRMRRLLPGGFGGGRGLFFIVLIGVALWLATGFYRVEPDEQGVALIFGRVWKLTQPGLSYNLPSPIGQVFTPKVTRVNRVEVGFRSAGDNTDNSSGQDVPEEGLMLTGDKKIIDMQYTVFWAIKDPIEYLFAIRDPEDTVKNVAESAMREIVGRTDFEYVRTKGQAAIEHEALVLIQQLLDNYHAGIEVSQVAMKNIAPPSETIAAFRDIAAAGQDATSAENQARGYYNQVKQNALGQAQQIIKAAEAYREQTVAIASGEAQRFEAVLKQYQKAKEITERRLYLETMEELLKNMNKVLVDSKLTGGGTVPYLSLNELMKHNAPPAADSRSGGTTGAAQ
jgi:membrane protease subunit HflK